MDTYKINTEAFEKLEKSIERLTRVLTDSIGESNLLVTKALSEKMQEVYLQLTHTINLSDYQKMFQAIQFDVAKIVKEFSTVQIDAFKNIDFDRLYKDSLYQEQYKKASKAAFEYVENNVEDDEENILQEELQEIFVDQIENKIGWQERLYNKSETFKRKYFVFYKLVVGILFFIVSQIAIYFAQAGIAYAVGKIKSEPKNEAPVIYYFNQKTEVTIIGETNYYYMIMFTDDEGKEAIGYNAKRNIKIIPNENLGNAGENVGGKSY